MTIASYSATYSPRHRATRSPFTIVSSVVGALAVLAALVVGLSVATGDAAHAGTGTAHRVHRDVPVWVVRPCAADGDVDCRWDAQTMGDGTGHSYVVRELPGSAHMVCVFYVQPRYAATHDYCS